jgi:hypothetical protein
VCLKFSNAYSLLFAEPAAANHNRRLTKRTRKVYRPGGLAVIGPWTKFMRNKTYVVCSDNSQKEGSRTNVPKCTKQRRKIRNLIHLQKHWQWTKAQDRRAARPNQGTNSTSTIFLAGASKTSSWYALKSLVWITTFDE